MMKKIMIFATALMISLTAFSQDKKIKIGAFGAIPMGDTKDVSKTGFGIDATYLIEVSDKFDLGFTTGFSFFAGKKVKILNNDNSVSTLKYANAKYIPITGAVRFNATDKLYIGTDIGYAIGIGDDVKGGLHYKPRIGYQITDLIGINMSYTGLKVKGGTWKTLNFGVEFSL
tara:strand:- start:7180 stop:7695 length:516 start_codon:yes stop_codon:yes gene_type:complete